jgi:BirA family biotin operon repressor/biotin-[acetyl-CoA-carboxylase] ligase
MLPGFTVEILPEIDSTNTELMRRARAGQAGAGACWSPRRRSPGGGRLGREWRSAPGNSLTFSLGLPLAPKDWSGLSLAVGVSVAESLHPEIGLKWPNDLWWQDRKLAGILIETAMFGIQRYVVIGVGVNITQRDATGLSTPPVGLQELLPGIDAAQTLLRMAAPLVQTVHAFEQTFGFSPFAARFQAPVTCWSDRAVTLSDGLQGTACGVDPNRRPAGAYCRWHETRHQF